MWNDKSAGDCDLAMSILELNQKLENWYARYT